MVMNKTGCYPKICCFLFVLQCILTVTVSLPAPNVTIGVILSKTWEGDAERKALDLAVEYVNNDATILPSTRLKIIVNYSASLDPLSGVQKACFQISEGVTAIIGPITSTDIKAVSSVTEGLKVPIYSPQATNSGFATDHNNYNFLLRMESPDNVNVEALAEITERFLWQRIAVLRSNTDYAIGVAEDFYKKAIEHDWQIVSTEEFNAIKDHENLDVRTQLAAITKKGVRVVLLSCVAVYTPIIMRQAKELSMIKDWAWIIGDSTFNPVPPVAQEMVGLVGIRGIVGTGTLHSYLANGLQAAGLNSNPVSYAATKRFDSVLAFAKGLHDYFQAGNSLSNSIPTCESCSGDRNSSAHGDTLISYLKQVQTDGASHFLNFSSNGSPGTSNFEVVNLQSNGWHKIGYWQGIKSLTVNSSKRAIIWPGGTTDIPVDTTYKFGNDTLKIVTILEPGFIQLKEGMTHTDPDAYEGLCIDLIKRLAKDLHFNYTLELVADGKYGSYDKIANKWTGMVGELIAKKYDMALSPMTISQSRSAVVEFSKPYMDLGLGILMQIPSKPEVNIFGFVDPLSREVWFSAFTIMVVIALISLLLDKISPNGHYGSVVQAELDEGCEKQEVEDELQGLTYMNLTNSMWFSIGALLQQGGDVLPRSVSGRTVAAFWWAASMIMIATYTANLAAFLTFSRMKLTINSVESLASQDKISYGTPKDSPSSEYFEKSILPSFNAMFQYMKSRGTLTSSMAEGFKRVREEDFAFIFDSIMLHAEMYKKPCDVFTVGQSFGKFGYGLAFPKESPYRTRFSLQILQLREEGAILYYEDYWFKTKGDCTPDLSILQSSNGQLTLEDMIGVLYVVYVGIVIGLLLIIVEWCVASFWEVDPTDPRKPRTWGEAMKKRICRIRDDLLGKVPEKLKFWRKKSRQGSSATKVSPIQSKPAESVEKVKGNEAKVNKGFQDNEVHPFQITE